MATDLHPSFPRYSEYGPAVPVSCVTPGSSGAIHRFYDSSPFSPSGKYLALTRLPFEDHLPRPGDVAEVLLVDLETGEQQKLAETRGWDTQLGAQVQWGADDRSLLFNDVDPKTWTPLGVVLDPTTGSRRELEGTIYAVSPDGKQAVSPCLKRTGVSQPGYGVILPPDRVPKNEGAPADDGLYITDIQTGKSDLLVSLEEVVEAAMPPKRGARYKDGDFYGFHAKWNPQGTRLIFVLRWLPRDNPSARLNNLITMDADGRNPRVAVPDTRWAKGGHHPSWCPDGEHIIMNLNLHGNVLSSVIARLRGSKLRFATAKYDGSGLRALNKTLVGSGHPTMHPDGRHVLTDAYWRETVAFGDGTAPIRWLDLLTGDETQLVRIRTLPDSKGHRNALRVDPHPAWDREFRRIAFNACPDGKRQVFVADMSTLT